MFFQHAMQKQVSSCYARFERLSRSYASKVTPVCSLDAEKRVEAVFFNVFRIALSAFLLSKFLVDITVFVIIGSAIITVKTGHNAFVTSYCHGLRHDNVLFFGFVFKYISNAIVGFFLQGAYSSTTMHTTAIQTASTIQTILNY